MLGWLTKFWIPIGKRVIIIGGTLAACEVAEFLVKRGRKVTIVDSSEEIGQDMIHERKIRLFWWLRKKGVAMLTQVKYERITDKGLSIIHQNGQKETLEADSIVPTVPSIPNLDLFNSLNGKVPEIYVAGDCREPGQIPEAVAAGWKIAREI